MSDMDGMDDMDEIDILSDIERQARQEWHDLRHYMSERWYAPAQPASAVTGAFRHASAVCESLPVSTLIAFHKLERKG